MAHHGSRCGWSYQEGRLIRSRDGVCATCATVCDRHRDRSGQKNLIYRAPINQSADLITVQFELEHVTYRPVDLVTRLDLAKRVRRSGKPALVESPSAKLARRLRITTTISSRS